MQLRHPSPDPLLSFSDFLLERFGLVASMQVAFVASLAIHLLLVIGIGFKVLDWRRMDAPHNVLDVVLVNSKSAAKPAKADALAQSNLDGGGNTDEKRRAASPFPALEPRETQRELREARERQRQVELEHRELMTRLQSAAKVANLEAQTRSDAKADQAARELVERSLEIARLEAQIRRDWQAYQERPRKTYIGARAQEYRFAQYVDNWRQRVERIGNLNYPEEARARRLYGSLQLTVGIKPDGEIESVEINRRSQSKILDQAAVRILRLAGPFDRFPEAIRADTDILYITRTWTFARGDQVFAD